MIITLSPAESRYTLLPVFSGMRRTAAFSLLPVYTPCDCRIHRNITAVKYPQHSPGVMSSSINRFLLRKPHTAAPISTNPVIVAVVTPKRRGYSGSGCAISNAASSFLRSRRIAGEKSVAASCLRYSAICFAAVLFSCSVIVLPLYCVSGGSA